jgi:hypothetical protein
VPNQENAVDLYIGKDLLANSARSSERTNIPKRDLCQVLQQKIQG